MLDDAGQGNRKRGQRAFVPNIRTRSIGDKRSPTRFFKARRRSKCGISSRSSCAHYPGSADTTCFGERLVNTRPHPPPKMAANLLSMDLPVMIAFVAGYGQANDRIRSGQDAEGNAENGRDVTGLPGIVAPGDDGTAISRPLGECLAPGAKLTPAPGGVATNARQATWRVRGCAGLSRPRQAEVGENDVIVLRP